MLRKIRIALASIFFVAITLMFLDFTGTLHTWFSWMAKLQFLPAVLALNVGVIVLLVLLTLVFGRVYCSVICPMGVFQDVVSHVSGMRDKGKKKMRFTPSPEKKWLRYGIWVIFVVLLIAGVQALVAILAPYSAYGRIVQNIFAPLYQWGNNLLAYIAERANGYGFYPKEVWLKSLPTFIVAAVTLIAVVILAWKNGRTYCNTICPVGTTLSFFSRFSLFRPMIDTEKCKNCHICEKKCKTSCINIKEHTVDYSRCVDCFNCIENCKFGAMKYRFAYGKKEEKAPVAPAPAKAASAPAQSSSNDAGRRAFIASSAIALTSAALHAQDDKKTDGGLADILPKKKIERETPITPFGSESVKDFYRRCTACQLCVSACPNNVLRPSSDFNHFMQPEMSYEKGYCRPECVKCSEVCPAGAIKKITPPEKTQLHIGIAKWNRDLCVVITDGVDCGNCARHCPTGAIMMVSLNPDNPRSPKIPAVNESVCIGCGACENLCPARPISAITVNGLQSHIKN
ncbi:MAG: 4Fe-4S dicluster domain-containing protein [Bacteroidales bacterium]|nr:4Fe-4S dicluster domain-containing protein [Bacteroidales bacterium]